MTYFTWYNKNVNTNPAFYQDTPLFNKLKSQVICEPFVKKIYMTTSWCLCK